MRRFVISLLVLLFLAVGGWLGYVQHGQYRMAPSVGFPLVDGRLLSLKELRGRPVLITFWATSCRSCVEKIPALRELYQQLAPRGLEIIAVAMAYDPPNRVLQLRQALRIPYPVALDVDGSRARVFDEVNLTPTTLLIDPEGRIVSRQVGEFDLAELRQRIEPMLAPAGG